jgi:soluble lytic murein transglycosylase-like protein
VHYSGKYGIPSALAIAVAHAESTFDPNAVSSKGASGVMQVMWRIHNQLLQANGIVPSDGSNPLSDPEQAIAAGCLLLSRYLRAYGSVATAMERYYGGRSASYQRKIDRTIARILVHRAELYQ